MIDKTETNQQISIPSRFILTDVERVSEPIGIKYMCSETSATMLLKSLGIQTDPIQFSIDCLTRVHKTNEQIGATGFTDSFPCINWYLERTGSNYQCYLGSFRDIATLKSAIFQLRKPILVRVKPNSEFHTVAVVGYDENNIVYHEPAVWGKAFTFKPDSVFDWEWIKSGRLAIYCRPKILI